MGYSVAIILALVLTLITTSSNVILKSLDPNSGFANGFFNQYHNRLYRGAGIIAIFLCAFLSHFAVNVMMKRNPKIQILICLSILACPSLILPRAFADRLPSLGSADFTLLNFAPSATARCVAIKDDVAFIGSGGSILVYDIRNIGLPEKVAEIKTFGIIMKMAIADNFLYVAAGRDGMYVFDIQDHRSLKCIMHLSFDRFCSSIFLYKDLIFLGQEGALKVFKNKNGDPATFSLVKEISIEGKEGQVERILIEGDKLFAACLMGGLYVFSLQEKDNFKELKHISLPRQRACALAYAKGVIYFNLGNMLYALDTGSFAYKKLHTFPYPKPYDDKVLLIMSKEDYLYVSFYYSIYIFQIKAPFSLRSIRKYILPGDHVRGGVMYKNSLFVADEDAGVIVFDVKAPERLSMQSRIQTPGEIVGLAMDKDNLFVCDLNGLTKYNIHDPLKFESNNRTFIEYPGALKAIIQGKYIFIGRSGDSKSSYVDICELPSLEKVRTLKFPGELWDMQILNNQLFVAVGNSFYVYDISSIQHPRRIYNFRAAGFLKTINFYNDMLLISQAGEEDRELPTLFLKLDKKGRLLRPFNVVALAHNPLGEDVRSILHSQCVDRIKECAEYTYIIRGCKLLIFSKTNNALRFVYAVCLPDGIRDIAIRQFQDVAYVYLAVEDAGLYVLKHRIKRFAPEP